MNLDPVNKAQELLNELGTKGLVDDIPNVVDARQTAACVPGNDLIHIFWDISLADQYGKFGPGSKHYAAFSKARPEWAFKESFPEWLSLEQGMANQHMKNAIALGRNIRLAQATSEEVGEHD